MDRLRPYFQRHSVYRVLLFSYLAIAFVSVLLFLVIMRRTDQILREEIIRANQASMRQLRQLVDDGLRGVNDMIVEQSMDLQLSGLIHAQRGAPTAKQRVDAVDVVRSFRQAQIAGSFVDNIYLMLLGDRYVLTDMGKLSLEEFHTAFFGGDRAMSLERMREMHADVGYKRYVVIPSGPEMRSQPVFLYALPLGNARKTAVLGVMLSVNQLSSMIRDSEWLPGAHVYIVDERDEVLNLSAQRAEDALDVRQVQWNALPDGQPQFLTIGGRQCCVLSVRSSVSPWRYGLIVPADTLLGARNVLIRTFATGMAVMTAVGVLLAVVLARWQYRPLRKLAGLADAPRDARAGGNEYHIIERRMFDYRQENAQLSRINKMQGEELIGEHLRRMLEGGQVEGCDIADALMACGLPMRYPRFGVLAVGAQRGAHADMGAPLARAAQELTRAHPEALDLAAVRIDRMLYAVFNCAADVDTAHLRAWGEAIQRELAQSFAPRPLVAVSALHGSADGIHDAYLEIEELREYQRITGGAGVLCHEDLPTGAPEADVGLLLEAQKLGNLLRARQFEPARRMLSEIMLNKLRAAHLPKQVIACNLYGLIYALLRALEECDAPEALGGAARLMRCDSVEALDAELGALLTEWERLSPEPVADRAEPSHLVEEAVALIRQRYSDPLLSVAMVAQELDVSPIALTRAFKRALGVGVLDYIHMSRLGIAKRLLMSTDESVAAIARRTGYNNNVTFMRVFKKYEAITPSQYRAGEREAPEEFQQ